MAPTRRNNEGLLARVNFPLYTLQMLTSRHVLVAGGGGSANTGVANGFEIFEISHNGSRFVAEEVIRHETGPSVVMNCATHSDGKRTYLVAGQESHCQLYTVGMKVEDLEHESNHIGNDKGGNTSNSNNVRHRKPSESDSKQNKEDSENKKNRKKTGKKTDGLPNSPEKANKETNHVNESEKTTATPKSDEKSKEKVDSNLNSVKRRLAMKIQPNDSIQTDFNTEEPLQRVVRISPNAGTLMVTGGTDGTLRVWDFPQLKKILEIHAHSKEIDDVDISPNDKLVASIAKDGLAVLWNLASGKRVHSLTWPQPEGSKYLYKRCRFGINEGDIDKSRLFLLTNPVGRPGKLKSYLQLWDPREGSLKKAVSYDESLSALAVSDDGRFVSVGTMFSGSVGIHIAFSLQRVLLVTGAHNMFVTGLEFLPRSEDMITSRSEAAVLSISVDNKVCIHSLSYRHTLPMWFGLIIMIFAICLAFVLMSYLGV